MIRAGSGHRYNYTIVILTFELSAFFPFKVLLLLYNIRELLTPQCAGSFSVRAKIYAVIPPVTRKRKRLVQLYFVLIMFSKDFRAEEATQGTNVMYGSSRSLR